MFIVKTRDEFGISFIQGNSTRNPFTTHYIQRLNDICPNFLTDRKESR